MPDSLQALIRDTLLYLKDPLVPKKTLFSTAEESALFQKKPNPRQTVALKVSPPARAPVLKEVIKPAPVIQAAPNTPAMKETKPEQPAPVVESVSPLKKILQKIAPAVQLTDEIPGDAEAKKIASAYRDKITEAEVVLLACQTDAETLEFLKTLAKAIDQHLGKTKILPTDKLEQEKRWDLFLQKNTFKLIIASDGIQKLPELMRFYRSLPASAESFLDKTQLIALSPATHYKALEHKALLWKTLCQILKK